MRVSNNETISSSFPLETAQITLNPRLLGQPSEDTNSPERELAADVNMIGQKLLLTASQIYKRPIVCEFTLTQDEGSVVSTDGKTIFVQQKQLLADLKSMKGAREEKIAVILSHELGHCIAEHIKLKKINKKKRKKEIKLLNSKIHEALGNKEAALAIAILSQIKTLETNAPILECHAYEKEADEIGTLLFLASGYRAESINVFLEHLKSQETPKKFYFTHPETEQRIRDNQQFCDTLLIAAKVAAIVVTLALFIDNQQKSHKSI